jgi:hypothetical protein
MSSNVARRKFIAALGGAAASWPRAVRAQQRALPVVGFVNGRSAESSGYYLAAFRQGLQEAGFVWRVAEMARGNEYRSALKTTAHCALLNLNRRDIPNI